MQAISGRQLLTGSALLINERHLVCRSFSRGRR
jgi:hypothetical protein